MEKKAEKVVKYFTIDGHKLILSMSPRYLDHDTEMLNDKTLCAASHVGISSYTKGSNLPLITQTHAFYDPRGMK